MTAATAAGLATREATFTPGPTAASGITVVPGGNRDEGHTALLSDGTALLGRFFARTVSWPEFTLYHGGVVGIGWPGPGFGVAPGGLAGGPPAARRRRVRSRCVGNTLTEALAACLAHNEGTPDEARILEAVLLGAARSWTSPTPRPSDRRPLHASGFAGLPGGTRSQD